MGVLSAKDLVRFTPATYGEEPGAPVYLLAPPSWRERARIRAAEAEAGLRYPGDAEVARAVRETIEEAQTSNMEALLATVTAFEEMMASPPPVVPPEGTKEAKSAKREREELIAQRQAIIDAYNDTADRTRPHPRVGSLLGRRKMFEEMVFPLRASFALRGWENVFYPFRLVHGVAPDDVLDAIPEADLKAIGVRASQLMAVSETQRGN